MKNTIIAALLLALSLAAAPALAAQQDIAQLSAVTASREDLRTAINTQLSAVQANFDEIYAVIDAGPVYVNASAPADTKVVWIDTDQSNAIKVYVGGAWTVVGSGGDDLGSAAYSDVVALWTTCTGYLKSDGTCDTPSGSATYPSAAGVANWGGSAWGTSYAVGTEANNLVQLNSSAQLPAVSADLLTITDTNSRFTTDTVGAALVQIGEFNASLPNLVFGTGLTLTEDTPSAGTDTVSVSANTYQAYDADWLGITPNGAALVSAANYAAMKTLLDTDDIQTLTGIAAGTAHLGTFTGTTIADSSTIKAALQSLETSVETKAPSANPVFTTSAAIPQGASPTVDAAGEIAVDTTSDQFIYYGGAKRVLTHKKQIDFAVKTPVDADDFLLFKAQTAITITDIHVIAQGGTSISVDIQECDSAGVNCATVDAAITADTDGAEDDGTLSNGTIDAGDWVKVVLGAPSGTVNYLAGSIYYVETAD